MGLRAGGVCQWPTRAVFRVPRNTASRHTYNAHEAAQHNDNTVCTTRAHCIWHTPMLRARMHAEPPAACSCEALGAAGTPR